MCVCISAHAYVCISVRLHICVYGHPNMCVYVYCACVIVVSLLLKPAVFNLEYFHTLI